MKKVLRFPDLNFKVKIMQDTDAENPRTAWDNLGTCLFFHGRYNFGDKDKLGIRSDDYSNFAEMKEALIKKHDARVILPVYMYDHSGQTINTTGFSCPWDSGQLGFIYVTGEQLRKEYSSKRVTKEILTKAESVLQGEIETLDTYIRGEVYGFKSKNKETGETDSCWGFYGDTADNGIFDHLDIEREKLTFEMYKEAFDAANWE